MQGAAARVVAREPGFAIKVVAPPPAATALIPPGQGQLLIPLRGSVSVEERSDGATKVTQTARRHRSVRLGAGQLWRIPNDAAWRLASDDGGVVLQVSTSVPRQDCGADDLLVRARRRIHVGPSRLFGNEALRVQFSAGRGRLPGLAWVPWHHQVQGAEYAIGLAGRWRARLRGEGAGWTGDLLEGFLLRVPPSVAHNFAARSLVRPSLRLSLTSLRRTPEGPVSKEAVRGFSPFVDRG